jgi:CRP/FNR family cyclic AMP-dependent transcriptional regulator
MALDAGHTPIQDLLMTPTLCALLTQTWFAADMPAEVCERLSAIGEIKDYPTGTTVVQEGLLCRSLAVILSGRIALRLGLPGVGDQTILTLDEGDVLGWSALLPGSLATSTGVTLAPTTVLQFERDQLTEMLANDCDLAAAIYPRVLVAVARRLEATRLQLLDLYRAGHEPW